MKNPTGLSVRQTVLSHNVVWSIIVGQGLHYKAWDCRLDRLLRENRRVYQDWKSLHTQAVETKGSVGLLDIFFPPLYLSFNPLCYTFALFAKKRKSSLTEEAMTQGQVCRLCGWNYWGAKYVEKKAVVSIACVKFAHGGNLHKKSKKKP